MRLVIVRHAQSANNAGTMPRLSDPHITEIGERQAELVAGALESFDIDLLYVSPMRRTLQTAAPIAAATGLLTRVFTGLHEWGGVYEELEGVHTHHPGLGRAEMTAIIPDLVIPEDVTAEGWWSGELDVSRLDAVLALSRENATRYLDYLAASYPAEMTVAIVTHGGFGSILMEAALHIDPHPQHILRFTQNNTGHALLEITEHETVLRWHNRIDHLPPELITH